MITLKITDHDPESFEAAQSKINTLYAVIHKLNEDNRQLQKECDRLQVIATKWCDRTHHDWKELTTIYTRTKSCQQQ